MSPLYFTGFSDGKALVGGIWRMKSQEGFPVELSALQCASAGIIPDWMEAMADASTENECPSLMDDLGSFMTADQLCLLRARFTALFLLEDSPYTYESFLKEKRMMHS